MGERQDPRVDPNQLSSAVAALEWIRKNEHAQQSPPCLIFEQNYGQSDFCKHCDWSKESHEWWQQWLTIQRVLTGAREVNVNA
jgi:hypothetical protein